MSLWTKPCTDGKSHGFNSIQSMIESIVLSSNVAKQHYSEIHFYTDKIGYEWIKPYLKELPFTKIEVCLDDYNWIPDVYWSFVKVAVYKLQKEPFLHIDNDVFLWDAIPTEILENKDFLFQQLEDAREDIWTFYQAGIKTYKNAIHPEFEFKDFAVNCGIFGCLTEGAFKILDKYFEFGEYFIKKAELNDEIQKEAISDRLLASVIIEQLFIYSLIVMNNLSFNVILDINAKPIIPIKYSHLLGESKRHYLVENMIKQRLKFKKYKA